jgi:GNAT superfamily N-acetyltransferase
MHDKIEPAMPGQGPLLSELAKRSKAYWGYDEAFMAACDQELTLTEREIARHLTYVLRTQDGSVAGFYSMESVDEARMELNFLFVEPSAIGRGRGRALINHAKKRARELGRTMLIIQGDPHAAPFYQKMGGRRVGERPSCSVAGRLLPLFEIHL